MTALDWILSLLGLAAFGSFLYIIASFVPQMDLLIVMGIAFAMAVYDFWIRPLLQRSNSKG